MAMHRITLTQIGESIGSTLDLYRWDGAAWVLLVASIPKTSLASGYLFEDTTGATKFKVVDTGACGTELELECESSTTTIAPTTTVAPTTVAPTTLAPTTTEPTTTAAPTPTTTFVGMQVFLDEGEFAEAEEVVAGGSYVPFNDPLAPNVGNFAVLTIYAVNCEVIIETGTAVTNTADFELDTTANPIPFTIASGTSKTISVEFYGSASAGVFTTDVGINHKVDGVFGAQFEFTLTQNVEVQ